MVFKAFTDGGSRGNPGPAAIGGVIFDEKNQAVFEFSKFVGQATNNEAEYLALCEALEWFIEKKVEKAEIEINLDSKLVVEQLNRRWKIKEVRMLALAQQAWQKIGQLSSCQISIQHVLRTKNVIADSLVNQALDLHG